jgi:hypothetical protein
MNSSLLAGSHAGSHMSSGSALGDSSFSHTGVNNSAFSSAHLASSTTFGHVSSTGSGNSWHGSGWNGGGWHSGCWNCGWHGGWGWGWGWGWGFGWGWGWGGWWNPWWWGPFWWGPPAAYYDPWWGWAPPAPAAAPGDYSLYYGDSGSTYNAPYNGPSSGYDTSNSFSASLGSPNLNPLTDNVANSTPTILLYLKDGTLLAASDYWIADNKLHYLVNYGGESVVDMDQVDLQRTVDENAKRGVKFWLKPNPNRATESPTPSASPAPAPALAPAAPIQTAADQAD